MEQCFSVVLVVTPGSCCQYFLVSCFFSPFSLPVPVVLVVVVIVAAFAL